MQKSILESKAPIFSFKF